MKKFVLFAFIILLSVLFVTCNSTDTPVFESRGIYPVGTATPSNYHYGIVKVRDLVSPLETPAFGQKGSHFQVYWSEAQASSGSEPNWSSAIARATAVAGEGMDFYLSLTFYEDGGASGGIRVPDSNWIPSGISLVRYYADNSNCVDYAPPYGNSTFRSEYADAITSMVAAFPNIAGYILDVGIDAEVINTRTNGICVESQSKLQEIIPCSIFEDWAHFVMVTWREATDKPLFVKPFSIMCNGSSSTSTSRRIIEWANRYTPSAPLPPVEHPVATPTPLFIGYLPASHAADRPEAIGYGGKEGWGLLEAGINNDNVGGTGYEPGDFPSGTEDVKYGKAADMLFGGVTGGASNMFMQSEWFPYFENWVVDIISNTLGVGAADSTMAFVRFRDKEYPFSDWGTTGQSGWDGHYYHLIDVPDVIGQTQYCIQSIINNLVTTGNGEPCDRLLSGTNVGYMRNIIRYPFNSTIEMDMDNAWQYSVSENIVYSATIKYYDMGTDTFTIAWKNSAGTEDTKIVTKGGTNLLATTTFAMTAAFNDQYTDHDIDNDQYHDIEIRTGIGDDSLYLFVIEPDDEGYVAPTAATATPTFTPPPTYTPTATSTPDVSITPTSLPTLQASNPDSDDPDTPKPATSLIINNTTYTLIQYDFSSLENSVILDASLYLQINNGEYPIPLEVCEATNPFTSTTTTYNNYVINCLGDSSFITLTDGGIFDLDVTDIITSMLTTDNEGFIIQ